MKASEIITDDIVSRERRRTRDVYDKKTTSQDYFGNRKDKQKDRELVSKEKNKERKKEWFEEDKQSIDESAWKKMGFIVRSDYTWPAMMLESANSPEYNEFNSWINKRRDSQPTPKKGSTGILAMIIFTGEMIMITYGPANYIDQTDTHYILQISSGIHEYSKKNQIFFDSKNSFDKFITLLNLKFSSNIKITIKSDELSETNKSVKEDAIEEGWKQNIAGAALAGAAALGGGGAHAAPQVPQTPQATSVASSNAAIVKSLVNPQAQKRFAAQHADTTAKLTDPRYDHNPDALAQHNAYPKQQHDEWVQNVRNAAQFENPYQIVRIALNKAGLTPQEVLQNLPKGYKLPTTEPTDSYIPKGTPRTAGVDEGSMQSATHKPQGPKFGGYYGATQKGPPKPGQGFGGAAESVGQELDEVAPPGMEDWVKKNKERFKKEYGDKKGSSVLYATAWKMHNKGKE
jgi:hypothetical protein